MDYEDAGTSLLAIASRDLKDGLHVPAFAIFSGVSKMENFTHAGQAELGKQVAWAQLPDKATCEAQRDDLQDILNRHTDRTVFRGKVLSLMAEKNIVLGDLDQASVHLEEAAKIFTYQGEYGKLAKVIHLQAAVHASNGDYEDAIKALKLFNRATTFSGIDIPIPSFVPAGWTPAKTFESETDVASLVALGSTVN